MTTPRPLPLTSAALAPVVLVAGLALAGCTKDDQASPSPSDGASTSAAPTSTPLPKEPTFADKTPAGARADVKVVDCPTGKGEQTVKLELTNSAKKARDYSILVMWLKNDSGTPLGSVLITKQDAAPGKKVALTGKAKVVTDADQCVLKVLAGTLK